MNSELAAQEIHGKGPSTGVSRTLRGTFVGTISFVVQASISVFTVPIFVSGWGQEKYGIWLSVQALMSLILTLDVGHQNYVGNEAGKLFHLDRSSTRDVVSSAAKVALLMGAAEFLFVEAAARAGYLSSLLGVPRTTVRGYKLGDTLKLLIGSWILVGSIGGIVARLYPPAGLFSRGAWWGLLNKVSLVSATVVSAAAGLSLLAASTVVALVTLAYGVLFLNDARQQFRDFSPFVTGGSISRGIVNLGRSLTISFAGFISQLQVSGLVLLVSGAFGATTVAVLGTLRTLANTMIQAANTVFSPAVAEFVRLDVSGHKEKLTNGLFLLANAGAIAATAGSLAASLVAPGLYGAWTRGLPFDSLLFFSVLTSAVWRLSGMPLANHMVAMNSRRWILLSSLASTITLFALFLLLSPVLPGLSGAGVAILASESLAGFILPAFWGARHIGVGASSRGYYRSSVVYAALPPLIATSTLAAYFSTGSALSIAAGFGALLLFCVFYWKQVPAEIRTQIFHFLCRNLRTTGKH